MSLKSKAKTTRQVIDSSLGTEDWDLTGLGITKVKVDFEAPLWISLEEATKAVFDKNLERFAEIKALEEKIKAANKILDEYTPNMMDWKLAKRVRCALCDIADCSTKGSVEPDECLLQSNKTAQNSSYENPSTNKTKPITEK